MKPKDWAPWAERIIGQSPAVASITRVPADDPPYVSRVELATGAQIYVQWVGGTPPEGSAPLGEPDPVVTGPPAPPVKVPELTTSGTLRTEDIERHLAALLNNGGHEEVLDVVGYTQDPELGSETQTYGLRVRCHSGATLKGLFRHTLRRGEQPGQGTEFKQRKEV